MNELEGKEKQVTKKNHQRKIKWKCKLTKTKAFKYPKTSKINIKMNNNFLTKKNKQ